MAAVDVNPVAYAEEIRKRIDRLGQIDERAMRATITATKELARQVNEHLLALAAKGEDTRAAGGPSYEYRHYQSIQAALKADVAEWQAKIAGGADAATRDAFGLGAAHPAALMAGVTPATFPDQMRVAREVTADLVKGLGKDAHGQLDRLLRQGAAGALDMRQLRQRMMPMLAVPSRPQERFGGLAYQAARIIRTENGRAFELANELQADAVVKGSPDDGWQTVWLHSGQASRKAKKGGGSRKAHVALHGTAVDRGDTFNVNGKRGAHPMDPELPAEEVVNCRCTSVLWNKAWGPFDAPFPPGSDRAAPGYTDEPAKARVPLSDAEVQKARAVLADSSMMQGAFYLQELAPDFAAYPEKEIALLLGETSTPGVFPGKATADLFMGGAEAQAALARLASGEFSRLLAAAEGRAASPKLADSLAAEREAVREMDQGVPVTEAWKAAHHHRLPPPSVARGMEFLEAWAREGDPPEERGNPGMARALDFVPGAHAPAKMVSLRQLADIAREAGAPVFMRGIAGRQYAPGTFSGPRLYAGSGIYGHGTYSAHSTEDNPFSAVDTARLYAGKQEESAVFRFTAAPGAKIGRLDDIRVDREAWTTAIYKELDRVMEDPTTTDARRRHVHRLKWAVGMIDEGTFAVLSGYDGYLVTSQPYFVMLTRRNMIAARRFTDKLGEILEGET